MRAVFRALSVGWLGWSYACAQPERLANRTPPHSQRAQDAENGATSHADIADHGTSSRTNVPAGPEATSADSREVGTDQRSTEMDRNIARHSADRRASEVDRNNARGGADEQRQKDANQPRPTPASQAPPEPSKTSITSDWCTDAVETLDEQTCYVLPEHPSGELLIYLHGLVPVGRRSEQLTHLHKVVAAACQRAGVAALIPRGVRNNSGKYAATWGWPSGNAYLRQVEDLVDRFELGRERLETLAGMKFSKVYVAGSSAGAYFVTSLALRADCPAHGFAALSGGGSLLPSRHAEQRPVPFYIGYGRFDPAGAEARGLERRLRRGGWPVRSAAHATGHGAREVYLDEAFAFWREAGHD